MQPDTITSGGPQGLNRYAYVVNNPINASDPSGHKCVGNPEECLDEDGRIINGSGGLGGGSSDENDDDSDLNEDSCTYHLCTEDTNLYEMGWENFGQAWSIWSNPNASYSQRFLAGSYMSFWAGAHGMFAVGAIILAWEALAPGSMSCVMNPACEDEISHLPANAIRFTQDTISPNTKAGVPLDTLTQEISNGFFKGYIRATEYEGNLFSLDNRRLAAFKLLDVNVPVKIVEFSEVESEFFRKFTTITEGLSIAVSGTDLIIK